MGIGSHFGVTGDGLMYCNAGQINSLSIASGGLACYEKGQTLYILNKDGLIIEKNTA
jgi:hypothetical protein